jgi:hypothetical protein
VTGSAWHGGYETRGPTRAPHVCPDCGTSYWNRGAHAEECRGPAPVPCGHLVTPPFSFGVRVPCRLPQGHRGPHQ